MRQRLLVSVVFGLLTGGVPCPKRSECVHAQQVYVRNIENRGEKMSELIKRFITATVLCLTALLAYAQEWTKEDSLRLRKLLDSDRELHLNQDVVKQIDFGSAVGTPRMSVEKKMDAARRISSRSIAQTESRAEPDAL